MQKQKTMRYQTSDYLDFDTATALVRKLYREEKYALSLLIGCGIFFGLRISDLLSLRWEQLLNEDDKFVIYEKKTNKRRPIKINAQFKPHIQACYEAIHPRSLNKPCFISQKHGVYSVQRINVLLKDIKKKYNLKIKHFSTHSLRKTFGRRSSSWRLPRDRESLHSSSCQNSSTIPTPASPESTSASKRIRC